MPLHQYRTVVDILHVLFLIHFLTMPLLQASNPGEPKLIMRIQSRDTALATVWLTVSHYELNFHMYFLLRGKCTRYATL
jgi:hypothetical protein